jgi:plasmid maintenance system antidote protein VapI
MLIIKAPTHPGEMLLEEFLKLKSVVRNEVYKTSSA